MKKEETYYELLKVERNANISEIVTAYHSARNAFSKDSLATYSLFSAEETEGVLKKLEEAYLTLSNLDRKREYDRSLGISTMNPPQTTTPSPTTETPRAAAPAPAAPTAGQLEPSSTTPIPDTVVNGAWLRTTREQHGMTIEDVSRLTKIPLSTLKAIETDNLPKLPARVYLQGFVSNLLKTYRVDVKSTKLYLENIDRLLRPPTLG